MKFFEMLADFFMTPIESVANWLDELGETFGTWLTEVLTSTGVAITKFTIEGIACCVICYSIYCACRVMCCGGDDDKFSIYTNKALLSSVCYFFAKCGGKFVLNYLGA